MPLRLCPSTDGWYGKVKLQLLQLCDSKGKGIFPERSRKIYFTVSIKTGPEHKILMKRRSCCKVVPRSRKVWQASRALQNNVLTFLLI